MTLLRKPWMIPEQLIVGDTTVVPLDAGQTLGWTLG
jgi:dihydroorotase